MTPNLQMGYFGHGLTICYSQENACAQRQCVWRRVGMMRGKCGHVESTEGQQQEDRLVSAIAKGDLQEQLEFFIQKWRGERRGYLNTNFVFL